MTRFHHAYPGWSVTAGFEGVGFTARRRVNGGSPPLAAATLDELAGKLDDLAGSTPS